MFKRVSLSFTLTAALLTALMVYLGFAPFGHSSFAIYDAEIQYLDFFAYLKHVLEGEASVTFSFDKGLGGNMWLVMTYYLLSPLNLLVVFFRQDQLHIFYDLLVVLKLSLSAATMTYYLEKRFEGKINQWAVTLISVGFGLMQYNMDQAMNIMWLDPVYMFPLMMLGLHRLRKDNSIKLLVISSALAMLFNWYTGLVAMMFVGFFSIWEYVFLSDRFTWRAFWIFEGKVILAITLAVGLNGIMFLPTLEVLFVGRGSSVDWIILDMSLCKKVYNILQGLIWGSESAYNQLSLFTGDLVTFGAIAFFVQRNVNRRLLIGSVILLVFTWLMFYWRPLLFLFSLLKAPLVYWYRYGFLGNFILIYLAALFFIHRVKSSSWRFQNHKLYIVAFAAYPLIVIYRQFKEPLNTWDNVLGALTVYAVIVTFFCLRDRLKDSTVKVFRIILTAMIIFGICCSSAQVMKRFENDHIERFKEYTLQQKQQIEELKNFDSGIFRISQSRPYENIKLSEENIEPPEYIKYSEEDYANVYNTVNYNEGLAYNYRSITTYTSSPINAQQELLDHMGYRTLLKCMNGATVSVLPADSLLGVKYILSDIELPGLKRIDELNTYNAKSTYENIFAMPLAFVCDDFNPDDVKYDNNPFTYTNEIYNHLFRLNEPLYQEVPYKIISEDSKESYIKLQPEDSYNALYGNIPTKDGTMSVIAEIEGKVMYLLTHRTSVFYIPPSAEDTISLHLSNWEEREGNFLDHQFYMLNESVLTEASRQAQSRTAQFTEFGDHTIKMKVDGKAGEKLFTTIPYEGWSITLNGKPVDCEVILGCFVGLTLEEGENSIEMSYSMPGFMGGCAISLVSLILFIFYTRRCKNETRIF